MTTGSTKVRTHVEDPKLLVEFKEKKLRLFEHLRITVNIKII